MANRYAITNGNWSNSAIWDNYATLGFPTSSDIVRPNGYSVVIDQNITILQLTNNASSPAVAGGVFLLANGITITSSSAATPVLYSQYTTGISTTTGSLVAISESNSATIIGNVTNTGVNNYHYTIYKTGTSNLTITGSLTSAGGSAFQIPLVDASAGNTYILGNLQGGAASNVNPAVRILNSCSLYVVGNVVGSGLSNGGGINIEGGSSGIVDVRGNVSAGANTGPGIYSTVQRTINIVGNVTSAGGNGVSLSGANSLLTITGSVIATANASNINNSAGANTSIYISGSVIGGPTHTSGVVYKTTTGTMQIIGPITSGLSGPGIDTNANVTNLFLTGPFYNRNNRNAVLSPMFQLLSGSTTTWIFDTETALEQRTLYTQNYPGNFPSASNVRQGTVFGDTNQFTGTAVIPPTGSVLKGVPVDNVTGSASFTTQNVWDINTNNLTTTGSLGARLRNVATVATDGAAIASKGKL